jgi:hypothetical protein
MGSRRGGGGIVWVGLTFFLLLIFLVLFCFVGLGGFWWGCEVSEVSEWVVVRRFWDGIVR